MLRLCCRLSATDHNIIKSLSGVTKEQNMGIRALLHCTHRAALLEPQWIYFVKAIFNQLAVVAYSFHFRRSHLATFCQIQLPLLHYNRCRVTYYAFRPLVHWSGRTCRWDYYLGGMTKNRIVMVEGRRCHSLKIDMEILILCIRMIGHEQRTATCISYDTHCLTKLVLK